MQAATILYNDRINCHTKMVAIDAIIDQEPTRELVRDLAELRIRNLMCFRELQAFNDTGQFIGKHPLLNIKTERDELVELLKHNPAEYLQRAHDAVYNVRRYSSFLNSNKKSEAQKVKFRELLTQHRMRVELMADVLEKHSVFYDRH